LLLALVNVAASNCPRWRRLRAYAVLVDEFDLSLGDVAERVGRSKSSSVESARLLELPRRSLCGARSRRLTEGHARAVLAVPTSAGNASARRIVRDGVRARC
jgi:ParB family chromosome partitioning protein